MAYGSISLGQSMGLYGAPRTQVGGSGSSYYSESDERGANFQAISDRNRAEWQSSMSGMSYSSGGSRDNRKMTSSTLTSTPTAPGIAMPTFGDVPVADEARIRRLTQTRSAAGQRALRTALRENILSASYQDNPNVGAMITRKAMEGFGQGIAETYTRAQRQATSEEYRDRQMKFSKQQAVFGAAMQNYMRRFGSTSKTEYDYEGGAGDYQYTFGGGPQKDVYQRETSVQPTLQSTRQAWLDKLAASK